MRAGLEAARVGFRATPLAPLTEPLFGLVGALKRPGLQPFMAKVSLGLLGKRGRQLPAQTLRGILTAGGKSTRVLARAIERYPSLIPTRGKSARLWAATLGTGAPPPVIPPSLTPPAAAFPVTPNTGAPMGLLFTGSGADSFGGGGDWAGAFGALGQSVASIFSTKAQTKQLKQMNRLLASTGMGSAFAPSVYGGAAATVPAASGGLSALLPSLLGGAAGALLPSINLPGGLEESGTGIFGPDLFAPTNAGARQRMIDAPHPTTGERVYWRPVGRPLMFSGDAALLKRTRKLARKLDAGCGAGRATFRRRRRR